MMTHGSLEASSASSPAEIRTSVMAASPVLWWKLGSIRSPSQNSHVCQHLAQLLGCGRDDGDEIGFANPPLGAMAHQVTARAAVKHRRMGSRDAGIAGLQAQVDDVAPIIVVFIERI